MTPADLKEATRLAAVAMGYTPQFYEYMAGWWAVDKNKPKDHFGDYQGQWFDPFNNAEQQLEMRRVLRIDMGCLAGHDWSAGAYDGMDYIEHTDSSDNLAALMVAAEIGRRKEQANG